MTLKMLDPKNVDPQDFLTSKMCPPQQKIDPKQKVQYLGTSSDFIFVADNFSSTDSVPNWALHR